jgi:RNA polymerase sigma-70 factor (ECF subfamily)
LTRSGFPSGANQFEKIPLSLPDSNAQLAIQGKSAKPIRGAAHLERNHPMSISNLVPSVSKSIHPEGKAAAVLSFATGQKLEPAVAERRRQDRELAQAILSGDADSFTRLHELYATRLYRFAVKRLGDATEAEDVVQDVFLEVHRCLASWEGRSALLTWMFGIAHHQLCRRFRRKTPIEISLDQLEASPPVARDVPSDRRADAARILEVCADTLDEDVSSAQQEIFDLYYGGNRPTKAIAEELGKSNQAVKISLFRTRRAMEARLEERGMQLIA